MPRAVACWFAFAVVLRIVLAQEPAKESVPFDVKGRAVTWDGQPIAGARVVFAPLEEIDVAELLRTAGPATAADGSFTVTVPPAGKDERGRVLVIAAKGFASCVIGVAEERPPLLDAKRPVELGDHVLPPGQRIVGRVRDATGAPVVAARITAVDLLPSVVGGGNGNFVCTARSNASGIFDLPCALSAGSSLEVEADGFHTARRWPVAAGTPLELELERSGFLAGQVRDAAGNGVAGTSLRIAYEVDAEHDIARTDAQGNFRATVRHPGRWRVTAWGDAKMPGEGRAPVGTGPANDVVVVFAAAAAPETPRKLTVQATRKGSTDGVRTLRAVAMWGAQIGNQGPWLRFSLARHVLLKQPSVDGRVEVDGPGEEGQTGALYVVADGCTPLLQLDVAWDEKNPSLTVELEPEASVSGVVRDAASGQPIAGAVVRATQVGIPDYGFAMYEPGEAAALPRTAADGRFRIGQLGAGEWQLNASVDGRPAAKPLTLSLRAGEALADVKLDVPVGARVAGKLVGAPLAPGCRVSLQALSAGSVQQSEGLWRHIGFEDQRALAGKPLAADGSFEFAGQPLGHYTLLLHVPAPPRSGASLSLPVDSFRLRAAGIEREIDVAGDTVRTLRGKLTFPGATTAFENLVVTTMAGSHGWVVDGSYYHGQGAHAIAGRDGSFALPVMPGSYRLTVMDMAHGIAVAASKAIEVDDADVQVEVEVPLVQVTVDLKPASGDTMAMLDRIELRGVLASQREAGAAVDADDSYDTGRGVRVPRGATSLTLALPHGDITLLARNHARALHVERERAPDAALGRLEVQIPGDKKTKFELEVAPPPEIPEPAPDAEKGEKGDGGGR